AGRHEQAIEHFERAARLLESDYHSLTWLAQSYEILGRIDDATHAVRRELERTELEIAQRPDNVHALIHAAGSLAILGERERAKQWLKRAMTIDPDDPMDHYNLGCALARMNEREQALDVLESCLPKLAPEMVNWAKTDPDLTPLRDHPRYQALIAREE